MTSSRTLSSLLAVLLLSSAPTLGCGADVSTEDPPTGPADDLDDSDDDGGDPPVADSTPVRLETRVDDQTLDVEQSVNFMVWAVNSSGDIIATEQAAVTAEPADVLEISAVTQSDGITSGTITGLKAGSAAVTARAAGLTSTALNFEVGGGGGGECEDAADYQEVCGGLYYRCGDDEEWVEATEGACTPSTPENCSCGHLLTLVSGGGGYCVDQEPEYAYEPTCDCSYCVPDEAMAE